MEQKIQYWFMRLLHYISVVYTFARTRWNEYQTSRITVPTTLQPKSRYFLGDGRQVRDLMVVPEGAIYIEEWIDNGQKKNVVRYPGDPIPQMWLSPPYFRNAKTPWVWVGDRETEIDLTRTFNRFLVVGNRITHDLVKKLINVTDRTNLIYIESGTFRELKFPGDGLVIEEYVDQPVQNSGTIHSAAETVSPAVMAGHNGAAQ